MFRKSNLWVIFVLVATHAFARAQAPEKDERAYRDVTPARLEPILKGLELTFKRNADKNPGDFYYDFEYKEFKCRLHNYGGKDLWIDAQFTDKLSLEDLNRWNSLSKNARAVQLKETVSLECQLDCIAGTSDEILKRFIQRYFKDLTDFVAFASKK